MDDCIKSDNGHSVAPKHYALRRLAIIFKMAWNSEASSYLFMSPEAIIRGNSEDMFWQKLNHLSLSPVWYLLMVSLFLQQEI